MMRWPVGLIITLMRSTAGSVADWEALKQSVTAPTEGQVVATVAEPTNS